MKRYNTRQNAWYIMGSGDGLRLALDLNGVVSFNEFYLDVWTLEPYAGGFAFWCYDNNDTRKYLSVDTTKGSYATRTSLDTSNQTSSKEMFYFYDLSVAGGVKSGADVAPSNIYTWNDKVIPNLLMLNVNGTSPFVDTGRIGEIARSWELDVDVDSAMLD